MSRAGRTVLILKWCAGLAAAAGLAIVVYRLEQRRPMEQLDRAGADLVLDAGRRTGIFSFNDPAANDEHLAEIARYPGIKSVSVSGSSITSAGLRHLQRLPQLSRLDLSETPRAGGSLTELEKIPSLRELNISGCGWVQDSDMSALASLQQLESLDLSRTAITDAGVSHLKACARLRDVNLNGCEHVTESGIANVVTSVSQLHTLSARGVFVPRKALQRMRASAPDTVIEVSVDFSDLEPLYALGGHVEIDEALNVVGLSIDGERLSSTAPFAVPDSFSLRTGFDADVNAAVARFSAATSLEQMRANVAEIDERLRVLADFPDLQRLSLINVPLTDDGLQPIMALQHLHVLQLRNLRGPATVPAAVEGHPELSGAAMREFDLSAHAVELLGPLDRLNDLRLGALERGSHLQFLAGHRHLSRLLLTGPVSIPNLEVLGSAEQLDRLVLVDVDTTPESVDAISTIRRLVWLEFRKCRFANGALLRFHLMPGLWNLILKECDIPDGELTQLIEMRPDLYVRADGRELHVPDWRRDSMHYGVPVYEKYFGFSEEE
jgi:hypothetical protein